MHMPVLTQGRKEKHKKNVIIHKSMKSPRYSVQESILRFCLGHTVEIWQLFYCCSSSQMLQCVYSNIVLLEYIFQRKRFVQYACGKNIIFYLSPNGGGEEKRRIRIKFCFFIICM